MTLYFAIVSFVVGSVFGSFINCFAWRITHHESILKGRSHCAVCGHTLGALDLVPIFSWLFLRGKCRYCGEKISPRYMLTELLLGAAFLVSFLCFGFRWEAPRLMALSVALLGLSLVDLEIQEIPDGFIIYGIVLWAVMLPLLPEPVKALWQGLLSGFLIGGGVLLISLVMDKVLKKESLGGGDVKLLFMVSLYMSPLAALFNLVLACAVGLLFVAALKHEKIPFGPSSSLASFVTVLVGERIATWYLGLF